MYFYPVLNGLWQGFVISILLFGPAFFKLIHTSIQEGFRKGVILASGVFLSDVLMVFLCVVGIADKMKAPTFQLMYSLFAGLVLIFMGLKYFRHRYKAFRESYLARVPSSKSLWKGFLLNLINPFTFILWLNVMASISKQYIGEPNYKLLLGINLMSILIVLLFMDVLKVFLSDLIGKKLNARIFFFINKYFGVLLMLIGLFFIARFADMIL